MINAEEVAAALGSYVRKAGGGYLACCPVHADKTPSLSIDVKDDRLLVKCFAGCEQGAVVGALRGRGLWPENSGRHAFDPLGSQVIVDVWQPVVPVPADAPPIPGAHFRYGPASQLWKYRNAAGELLHCVSRFDLDGGKKLVLPLSVCRSPWGRVEWRYKALPMPRPLYGLDRIGDARHLLFVEGEKAADAGRRILGRRVPVLTWSGGSGAVARADWSTVQGKFVAILPDADSPGLKAAADAARACLDAGAQAVHIVKPPLGVTVGWDLADAEIEGWTRDQVLEMLRGGLAL